MTLFNLRLTDKFAFAQHFVNTPVGVTMRDHPGK